jgi:hypothetical protein
MGTLKSRNWAFLTLALTAGCSAYVDGEEPGDAETVGEQSEAVNQLTTHFANTSLMITDLAVVNNIIRTSDPCTVATDANPNKTNRKWTAGYLLQQAAGSSTTLSNFVDKWIDGWKSTTIQLNGQIPRTAHRTFDGIDNWWGVRGNRAQQKAPFRLLAIVNRFDARTHRRFGEGLAGELRFVFGIVADGGAPCSSPGPAGNPGLDTIILEYAVDKANENDAKAWAVAWSNLQNFSVTDPRYLTELEKLTESVVTSGKGAPYGRPNGSALIRIRTSEGAPWIMREFTIDPNTHVPVPATVKNSPNMALTTTAQVQLGNWLANNSASILADSHTIPNSLPGSATPFLGADNIADFGTIVWRPTRPTSINIFRWAEIRHAFAIRTCSGCHSGETNTGVFQIAPRNFNQEASLSPFLTGTRVQDPESGQMFDMNDLQRRQTDILNVVNDIAVAPQSGTFYKLRWLSNSSRCLDVSGESTAVNGKLVSWTCSGNSNQRFEVVDATGGWFRLRNKKSGLCVDVKDASTANLASIVQNTCSSARDSQRVWIPAWTPESIYQLKFKHSNKCLDVIGGTGATLGADAIQYTCDSTKTQQKFGHVE